MTEGEIRLIVFTAVTAAGAFGGNPAILKALTDFGLAVDAVLREQGFIVEMRRVMPDFDEDDA